MHPSLAHLSHRPWTIPARRWMWRQSWYELLFAHYRVPVSALRPLVPPSLTVQEYDGSSWVGVVPFRMVGVSRRWLPNMPFVSAFPELNVRLYVEHNSQPGVWFLSLDATSALAVWGARRFFHLPYHHARITISRSHNNYHYLSQRRNSAARFEGSYRPTSAEFTASPGSLEHFLAERYCMYTQSRQGQLYVGHIHHAPWPLQHAEGTIDAQAMLAPFGLTIGAEPPVLHYSRGVDTVVWGLEAVKTSNRE